MDGEMSFNAYKKQLEQIDLALETSVGEEKQELLNLKANILELLSLTEDDNSTSNTASTSNDTLDDEYALFMSEMEKEGVVKLQKDEAKYEDKNFMKTEVCKDLKSLEGMKCRAPHKHQWGDTVYHNAMICSAISENTNSNDDIEVKVLFMNPTHQEMLPCPYFLETDCKFSEDKCRYSHGETVAFSDLQEYVEPKFEQLSVGSAVLAKQSNNLWYRALVRRVYNGKCLVKFESNQKSEEILFEHLFPLGGVVVEGDDETAYNSADSESPESEIMNRDDVINMSLMNTPSTQALGDWEKHTKGIGSKLMEKMGYIVGTGLGRNSDGRLDPVTAVILPAGKSLDHCMELKERAGGDKNLFSAERKLKRLQRKQELQSKKAYEREKKKVDVFNFLNECTNVTNKNNSLMNPSIHRTEIKKESARDLNVASLKTEENIRKVERDLYKISTSLTRHSDSKSQMNKSLQQQLLSKQNELKLLQAHALNIKNEQNIRNDKKKMTIF